MAREDVHAARLRSLFEGHPLTERREVQLARNPFLFIVGCSRSGTTLLQHVMDAHPHIGIIPENRWLVRWFENRYGLTPEGFVTPALVSRLLEEHRLFRDVDLGIHPEELYGLVQSGREILYADFVSFIFDRYGKARGKPLVGNKTPGFVRRLRTIHTLWPQAKCIHIIRDGRDVYLSAKDWNKLASAGTRFRALSGRFAT